MNESSRRPRRVPILTLLLAAVVVLPTLVVASSSFPSTAVADSTAVFDLGAVKAVSPTSTADSPLRPGDTVTYTINYSCSLEPCVGATITDVLPTYTDLDGETAQLQFVSADANPAWSFDGVSTNGGGLQQISWTATADLEAGSSGALFVHMRIPPGTVPVTPEPQEIQNTAVGSFLDQSPEATSPITYLNALAPASQISKSGPGSPLLNAAGTDAITHTVRICPSAGTALWPNYDVVDTLPLGATVETDPLPFGGTFTPDGDPEPTTGGTIDWALTPTNRPDTDGQGCLPITFEVSYVNAVVGGHESNEIGATKTNQVEATGFDDDPATGQSIGPAQTTLTLTGPVTRFRGSKSTAGNYFVTGGDEVEYQIGASNSSDAEAEPFSTATLTDGPLPDEFTLTEIRTGTWTGDSGAPADVTAVIETSPDGTTWTQVASSPGVTFTGDGTVDLATVAYVRWRFSSTSAAAIGPGWGASGQRLIGTMTGAPDPSEQLQNCVALEGVQAGVQQSRPGSCATVELEVAQPHPSIAKAVGAPSPSGGDAGEFEPGDTVTYTLTASNDDDATGPLVDPLMIDCVPSEQYLTVSNVQPGSGGLGSWSGGVVANDTCDPGTTELQFAFDGSLAPGDTAPTVTYDVTAQDFASDPPTTPTPPGTYTNTVRLRQSDGAAFGHCVQSGCEATRDISLLPVVRLDSIKLVQGATDSIANIAGTTTPGGQVTYRLEVQNRGNTEVDTVEFIDVFPHIGDVGVRVSGQPRGSELAPFLVSPITAPTGWTVEYSLSDDPCRGGVGGPTSGCDAPNWTGAPDLTLLPEYRSIRLTYDPRLEIGASLAFDWQMVTPVNDPTYADGGDPYGVLADCTIPESDPPYPDNPGASTLVGRTTSSEPDCPVAVNSFAYGASIPDDQLGGLPNPGRLGAEPPAVDLHVAAEPQPNVVGDRVWNDLDFDGVQDAGEPGIASVRVELFGDDGTGTGTFEPLAVTFTDTDGEYLFEDLPDGDYRLRFHLPDDQGYVSPQNASTASAELDSDVPQTPTGADSLGNYYETADIALTAPDLSWDAGVWIPDPDISITKTVTGGSFTDDDANTAPGIHVYPGGEITPGGPALSGDLLSFTYEVTNTGNAYVTDVAVTDVVTTPSSGVPAPTPVCEWAGSTDPDTPADVLAPGETVTCTATDVESIPGLYRNDGTVTGTATQYPTDPTDPSTYDEIDLPGFDPTVSDDDPAHVTGVTFQVGDVVFLDADEDGRYTDGTDVPVPVATEVQLFEGDAADHDATDTPIATTITSLGRYVFSNLPPGTSYYVVIPASEFAADGSLEGFTVAPDAVTDPVSGAGVNEGDDHNAVFVNGTDLAAGVRSSISSAPFDVTLDGGQWVGDGPLGDGPLDPDAPDIYLGVPADRSDRTLDLGVVGLPALELSTEVECVNDTVFLRFRVDNNFEPVDPAAQIELRGVDDGGDPTGPAVDAFQVLDPGTPGQALAADPITTVPLGEWITVLWPEGALDAGFDPIGWPGWDFVDGRWVQVDTDVRPQLHLSATVNPDIDTTLAYPAPTEACSVDPPRSSIGDRVWWDQDADGTDDDGAEPGVPDATVTIAWAGPDGELGTGDDVVHPPLSTDADGRYLLDDLPAGQYRVEVTNLDPGFAPTYDVVGGTAAPSTTMEIELGEDEHRRDVDVGVRAPMALGDLVWLDVNGDGEFTPTIDVPLAEVPLQLWDPDGTSPIATTMTDADGRYLFDGLDPGEYEVRIPATAFTVGTMDGWGAAPGGSTDPDDDIDEIGGHDALDLGGGPAGDGVGTNPITLSVELDVEGNLVSGEPGTGEPGGELTNPSLDLALTAPSTIRIEKATNGVDADQPGGPFVPAGSAVTWTYVVTNTGDIPLLDVTVVDSEEGPVPCDIPLLLPGGAHAVTCELDGRASEPPAADQYSNVGTASGQPALPYGAPPVVPLVVDVSAPLPWVDDIAPYTPITDAPSEADGPDGPAPIDRVSDTDPSHHVSATPGVTIEKATNGVDADTGPGPWIRTGDDVTWTYVVTNTGNTPLAQVTVTDDRDVAVDCGDGGPVVALLAAGGSHTCSGTGSAGEGAYDNLGAVVGTPADGDGEPIVDPDTGSPVPTVTDDDPSHHRGANPIVEIVKQVCGLDVSADCDESVGAHWVESVVLPDDQPAVWRLTVRNTGNVVLDPVVVDDPEAPDCDRDLDALAPGDSVRYTCELDPLTGPVDNVATVAGTPVDDDGVRIRPAPGSSPLPPVTASDDAAASPPPLLNVDKSASAASVQVGDEVTWTVVVTNEGSGPAFDVRVVDTLPSGLELVGPVSGMAHEASGNRLVAEVEVMEPGESISFTYVTRVTAAEGDLTNLVAVGALAPDGSTQVDHDDDAATVSPLPPEPFLPITGSDPRLLLLLGLTVLALGLLTTRTPALRRPRP